MPPDALHPARGGLAGWRVGGLVGWWVGVQGRFGEAGRGG